MRKIMYNRALFILNTNPHILTTSYKKKLSHTRKKKKTFRDLENAELLDHFYYYYDMKTENFVCVLFHPDINN